MIVSINQPAYLPWLGYFDRIDASDLHIILDHVQFEKNSLVNRNKVLTPTGPTLLTIPVSTAGKFGALRLSELRTIGSSSWRRKHWRTIEQNYKRAPCFQHHSIFLSRFYCSEPEDDDFLSPVLNLNEYFMEELGVRTQTMRSSTMSIASNRSELLVGLCASVGGTTYLSGPFGRTYIDRSIFAAAGINIKFHDYFPAPYQQIYSGFQPALSALDALMVLDGAAAASVMRAGRHVVDQ